MEGITGILCISIKFKTTKASATALLTIISQGEGRLISVLPTISKPTVTYGALVDGDLVSVSTVLTAPQETSAAENKRSKNRNLPALFTFSITNTKY